MTEVLRSIFRALAGLQSEERTQLWDLLLVIEKKAKNLI